MDRVSFSAQTKKQSKRAAFSFDTMTRPKRPQVGLLVKIILDSKIITFYTNTTPPFADFAKNLLPLRPFIKKLQL